MEAMTVQWQKCNDYPSLDRWCSLDSDILNDPRLEIHLGRNLYGLDKSIRVMGVYIIWAGMRNRTILKVGHGIIKNRFEEHLNDPKVQAYKHRGLYATWDSFLFVDKAVEKQRGVERFLGNFLNPVLGERFPANVDPIWVNLPAWDEPENPFLRALSQSRHTPPNGWLEQLRKKQRNPFFLKERDR